MKSIRILILTIVAVLVRYQPVIALEKGQTCPAFEVKSGNKEIINFSSIKGNVVYIDFWASWCPPCKKSIPWMNEIHKKYSDKGFRVLAINLDTERDEANKILALQQNIFLTAFDPEGVSPQIFEVSDMPTSFLIDRDGKISEVFRGFSESEKVVIEKKIQDLTGDISK